MIDKITTHIEDAKGRLLQQYKGKEKIEALIQILSSDRTQSMEDAFYGLGTRLDIEGSEGVQLDNIGKIVGQDRLGQSDEVYKIFIKARIGKNVSEGDIPRVIDVWQLITQASLIQLLEAYPAEVDLYADTALDSSLVDLAFALIQDVVGAGVLVGFIAVIGEVNDFGFEGSTNSGGFGSVISQGANTSVSANKLIDSGATFQTDGAAAGMVVYNTSDNTSATIVTVDSETQITLDADIFQATPKDYYINAGVGGELTYLQAAA